MKIIDFEKRGNVVRFYYGRNDCKDYWGDDWNDCPYEHNAGLVYSEYVRGHVDIAVDMDHCVLEPSDGWYNHGNTPYSKESMKFREVPCIIIVPVSSDSRSFFDESFILHASSDHAVRIYFGDDIKSLYSLPGVHVFEH